MLTKNTIARVSLYRLFKSNFLRS
uniref:Uncharacterized protein n=1 Tax=Arundo donax TaxID=35708 RepID=A0A0A9ERP4_ARUDO